MDYYEDSPQISGLGTSERSALYHVGESKLFSACSPLLQLGLCDISVKSSQILFTSYRRQLYLYVMHLSYVYERVWVQEVYLSEEWNGQLYGVRTKGPAP